MDDGARLPGAEFKGDPVAIYTILSHFDIVREFNTSTGEQSNVISENTSLKPWYEREYMRVEWSTNMLEGNVDLGGILAMSPMTTQSYYDRDTDVTNPDRLQLRDDFIFFTSNYVVNDGGYACLSGFGYPVAGGWDNCGAVKVEVEALCKKSTPKKAAQFEPKLHLDRQVLRR